VRAARAQFERRAWTAFIRPSARAARGRPGRRGSAPPPPHRKWAFCPTGKTDRSL